VQTDWNNLQERERGATNSAQAGGLGGKNPTTEKPTSEKENEDFVKKKRRQPAHRIGEKVEGLFVYSRERKVIDRALTGKTQRKEGKADTRKSGAPQQEKGLRPPKKV